MNKKKVLLMNLVFCMFLMGCSQDSNIDVPVSNDSYCLCWYYIGYGKGIYAPYDVIFYHELSNYFYEKNGKTYQMVYSAADGKQKNPFPIWHSRKEMLGIREAGGRVYVDQQEYLALMETSPWNLVGEKNYIPYEKTPEGEFVIYDYNMQVGDKFPHIDGHKDISVVGTEPMVTYDGVSRRLLTLSNGYKLLEGIGCLNSPGLFFFYLNPILWEYYDKAWLSECGYGEYEDFPPESLLIYRADEMEAK